MLLVLLGIFVGGVLLDVLQATYVQCIARNKRLTATLVSGLITFVGFVLWSTILRDLDSLGLPGAATLAGGSVVGTAISLHRKKGS